jgi:hypothetical protein
VDFCVEKRLDYSEIVALFRVAFPPPSASEEIGQKLTLDHDLPDLVGGAIASGARNDDMVKSSSRLTVAAEARAPSEMSTSAVLPEALAG